MTDKGIDELLAAARRYIVGAEENSQLPAVEKLLLIERANSLRLLASVLIQREILAELRAAPQRNGQPG